ncbi:MAG: hypothetical protein S0880_35190 [Actinomycetota bacterium]|nr:hypothetical protein [Actinomycetota bacterium]
MSSRIDPVAAVDGAASGPNDPTVGVTAPVLDGANQPRVDPRVLAWRLAEDGVSPETRRTVLAHQHDEDREAVERLLDAWDVELGEESPDN